MWRFRRRSHDDFRPRDVLWFDELRQDVRNVSDVREPVVMAPLAQMPAGHIRWAALTFVLRTASGDPLRLASAVHREDLGNQSQHRYLRDGHDG